MFKTLARKLSFVALLGALSSGCGFHLRGSSPGGVQSLYLEGLNSGDAFDLQFDRAVELAGAHNAETISKASGVVHVYKLLSQRRALTLGRFGRANEFDLVYRLAFDIRTAQGEIISPRQEIELHRDYYNDQSLPIAQQEEEGLIRAEMRKEIAQALVRRATYAIHASNQPKS